MKENTEFDEMRPEYDFSGGVRGKHHVAYQQGTNVILLDPDIAKIFKDSEAVNHALRMLINLAGSELKRNLDQSRLQDPPYSEPGGGRRGESD